MGSARRVLRGAYTIDWQKGLDNLYQYINWINSCRLLVTNDSLGMHLAIALKKRLVALFGPSSHKEVYLYGRGVILTPQSSYTCIPCLKRECSQKKNCMHFIKPRKVAHAVEKLLS